MGLAMNSGIYCIENLVNGKMYIGQTKNLKNRKRQHFYELRGNYHPNPHLQNAFNKYGERKFKFKILEYCECKKDVLTEKEQFFVDSYNPDMLYNIRLECVDSSLGIKASEETKRKLSKLQKNRLKNPKNHPFYGKNLTCKHKKNISLSSIGEKNANSTLTKDQVYNILDLYFNKCNFQTDIAKMYGVDKTTISKVCLGKTWRKSHKNFMNQKGNKNEKPNENKEFFTKLGKRISMAKSGKNTASSKLTEEQVFEILDLYYNRGNSQTNIAKKYNVTISNISCICRGQTWKYCYKKFMNQEKNNKEKPKKHCNSFGENNGNSKLTKKQVFEILDLYHNKKEKQVDIAKKYSVGDGTISLICNGKTWKSCFSKFCKENNINISEEGDNGI